MIRRLVLFDIDGTLVRAGELGAAVFDSALAGALGQAPPVRIRMSGKTDPQIVAEYLDIMGIPRSPELIAAVLRRAAQDLAVAAGDLAAKGSACPGAAELLAWLSVEPAVVSSVLTGNIEPNAVVKLAAFGLDRWLDLDVGAYGSDDADRCALVPVALSRLVTRRGVRLDADQVWVVGDTRRDLECARAGAARCLLVATGSTPASELAGLGADAVLDDLADTAAVVKVLTSGGREPPGPRR